ncbi:MAG: TrkA family potassium uptake protein [Candidatus Cloacimonadota bacterium]|nr:TrkA family potassium uptake protein [Candidatus Cloacimonadota bacterium]
MSPNQKLFIVIVGCGRLGSYLANRLSSEGHSIVIVDINESAFDALSAEYSGFRVEGDATELAVLKQAKIDKADLVIAATREDNINLMVAQVAKKLFRVPRVMARVFETKREKIYRDFGIETICPTLIAGDVLLESLMKLSVITEKGGRQ